MGLRDRVRVITQPDKAAQELVRWKDSTIDVRAADPGETEEYDPRTGRWVPVRRGR